ncbi:hypothetical protein [Sphingomonas sp. RB1R13]|uniref:hypothetical protein n=1 Tax=Sphingomonas sp. RB1R13 TaxID=3096159 RepID=UPI002FCBFEB8
MMAEHQRRPPGRPQSINMDIELYGYVRGELANGRTLSDIAKGGFAVYSHVSSVSRGKFVLLRDIKDQYFEAMYRAIEERLRPPFAKRVGGRFHSTPVLSDGMLSLEASRSVSTPRQPGRPNKKSRSR